MKDRRRTLCVVNVLLKNGGTGQFESPFTKAELTKLFEADDEWVRTAGTSPQEEVASIYINIRRSELVMYTIFEKNASPIKLAKDMIEIPMTRPQ